MDGMHKQDTGIYYRFTVKLRKNKDMMPMQVGVGTRT